MRFARDDPGAPAGTAALEDVTALIAALPPDQPLVIHGRRDGVAYTRMVVPRPTCRTRFEVEIGRDFVAAADGDVVRIGSRFLEEYPEPLVAAVVAHELAHNVLHHRARLEAQGVTYGLASGFGRNVRFFRQTELEADIVSAALLANSGYDPVQAIQFWRRFGPSHAGGPLRSRSHPKWRDRVATLRHAIATLGPDRPARPAILDTRDQPLDGNWRSLLLRARSLP